MKLIIAGSRTFSSLNYTVQAAINHYMLDDVEEVVSGGAHGIDQLGETWADENEVPVKRFPADWSKGKMAGPMRNKQMAEYGDALLIIWDGQSRGSKSMIAYMSALDKPIYEVVYKEGRDIRRE